MPIFPHNPNHSSISSSFAMNPNDPNGFDKLTINIRNIRMSRKTIKQDDAVRITGEQELNIKKNLFRNEKYWS